MHLLFLQLLHLCEYRPKSKERKKIINLDIVYINLNVKKKKMLFSLPHIFIFYPSLLCFAPRRLARNLYIVTHVDIGLSLSPDGPSNLDPLFLPTKVDKTLFFTFFCLIRMEEKKRELCFSKPYYLVYIVCIFLSDGCVVHLAEEG